MNPEETWFLQNPHDALFRAAFADPVRAGELLRSALPAALVAAIDWTTLRAVDPAFVDPELGEHHADLLFEARAGRRRVLIRLLYEHKATFERFLMLQVMRYHLRVWERFRAEQPEAELLPAIVSVVLYHGQRPWQGPTDLRGLLDLEGLPAPFTALQPQFHVVLDDLAATDAEGLHRRRLSVGTLLPLLHLQQVWRHRRIAELIASWRRLYRKLQVQSGTRQLYRQLVTYVVAVRNEDHMTLRDAYAKVGKPAEETMMSCLQRIHQAALRVGERSGHERGLEEGLQKGLQKGLRQGMQRGQIDLLCELLQHRFGELGKTTLRRLERASAAELLQWSRAVLTAQSLADVFGD